MIAPLLTGLSTLVAQAPPTTDAARLKTAFERANRYGNALAGRDYEVLADLIIPAEIKEIGGREATIKQARDAVAKLKAHGLSIDSMKAEPPEILHRSNRHLYCVVPMIFSMTAPGNKVTQRTYLLGVSADDGATWTFADGSRENKLRTFLPAGSLRT